MRSPATHNTIVIDVTNACPLQCSNCTRFCGHKKPVFMDMDTFRKAVDSLVDHPSQMGLCGGEPTIAPLFPEYMDYLEKTIGRERSCLFTSLTKQYYEFFERIQEVFCFQGINDHNHQGLHTPLLIASEELPIPEETKKKLIDNCWVQNNWSACVTVKGAFFCEVAAQLDLLFDGPGGWPIEPGWWKRTPDEFGDQLKWCNICGAAMPMPRRIAVEEIDDVSPGNYERLKKLGSGKIKKGKVKVFDVGKYKIEDYKDWHPDVDWFLPPDDRSRRIANESKTIRPKKLDCILACDGNLLDITRSLAVNRQHFDDFVVVVPNEVVGMDRLCNEHNALYIISECCMEEDFFDKGKAINDALEKFTPTDWIVIIGSKIRLHDRFGSLMRQEILNPGFLYWEIAPSEAEPLHFQIAIPSIQSATWDMYHSSFQLFNVRASSLKGRGKKWYPEGKAEREADGLFRIDWLPSKKCIISLSERKPLSLSTAFE